MSEDYKPETADYDGVRLDNKTYDDLLEAAEENRRHNVSESADKIRLDTQVKRGDGTRDEDRIKVQVKGDEPAETAKKLRETLDALESEGIATQLRETQPGDDE